MTEAKLVQVEHRYHPDALNKQHIENFTRGKLNAYIATECHIPYLLCYVKTTYFADDDLFERGIRLEALVLELSEDGINKINDVVEKYRETAKEVDPGAEDRLGDWADAISEAVLDTWPVL